jgi:hypothetical protein
MSGHVRFGLAACLVAAGYTVPAAANVLTDLFSSTPAPAAATPAPAPAQDECLRQPGPATSGGHWVYRYEGGRRCWFQAGAGTAAASRPSRPRFARRRITAPEPDEAAPTPPKPAEDAHAEAVKPAPAATPEPTSSAPKLTLVRTIPVHLADAAAQVPPAPRARRADQGAPASAAPPQVDVERLLAEAPAASDDVASKAAATAIAAPAATTPAGEGGIPSWPGVLLMAVGGAALLASSRPLRRTLRPFRIADPPTDLPAIAQSGRTDSSFAEPRFRFARARQDELLEFEPQSVTPLHHAAPARRAVAPPPPSKEALWEEGIGALAALASPVSPEVFSRRRAGGYGGMERRRRALDS